AGLGLLLSLAGVRLQARPADAAPADGKEAGKPDATPAKKIAEVRDKLRERYVKPVDDKALNEGAIKGMLETLRDPYTEYFDPAKLTEIKGQLQGSLSGIGAQLAKK